MSHPFLQFSFQTNPDDHHSIFFGNPIDVYQSTDINQVIPILKKVEKAINDGYYAAGFVSYEAAPAFDHNYKVVCTKSDFPLIYFAIFNEPEPNKSCAFTESESYHVSDWSFISNYKQYDKGIKAIKRAIKNGDTYQVNYTTQMEADFSGDPYTLYQQLKYNQKAGYSAYMELDNYQILSASPELFFQVQNGKIITKPMKGTSRRGRFFQEDECLKQQLYESEKERAENLMIVDLLRNDLGKIAKLGSVKVTKQLEIESYPTVHQMTSTITADLNTHRIIDWFQALFPCGSITGAPKMKTMEYIAALEQNPRGVYCGAIGYFTPKQEAIFNVPIRTVVIDKRTKKATYGVGSGVTWDSKVKNEYEELKTKAKLLTEKRSAFQLIETILLEQGSYPLEAYHVKRLAESAKYFNIPFSKEKVNKTLEKIKHQLDVGKYKVRLLLDLNGELHKSVEELSNTPESVECELASYPIDKTNVFHYHKTTNRSIYQEHVTNNPSIFSVLLWNDQEEITEFTFGNVVVELDGQLFTPPLSAGLLPGTYRDYLLEHHMIKERTITKKEVMAACNVWFINSLRGWISVQLK
ncbi:Aminodeoxychorismate synthase component 1 [Paraliobacillus sp. PM-2]|uniref:aminodeoxychorismate synthase component I n=1 Tax=Paraliobacillus sp. PM-2 TaxID=1462524 RepID=UPI00061BC3E6|nr:aminodeoxychorismate synthase component I [Paraliobacillus sp. PM-2]CQR46472.1 Aminodeoxychorismate synthase component 1 [Paraliobacillus sp. PM-2]